MLIHKSLFALVTGLAALRSLTGFKKAAIAMIIYSLASPVGIALGKSHILSKMLAYDWFIFKEQSRHHSQASVWI